jgi:nitrile hydratase subunit beta
MNGVHDMGGQQGFGPVLIEPNEPLFHAEWERRVLGLTVAMGTTGQWNIDISRSVRESLALATYLSSSYYRIWFLALEQLALSRGLVSTEEASCGHALLPAKPVARVLKAADVAAVLARGAPTSRHSERSARFSVGQAVRALNAHTAAHTRLPRYVRGHVGTITLVHGTHVFADRHAATRDVPVFDDAPEWLYTVAFDGQELWGPDAEPNTSVSVDAWEPYLEAVTP